MKMTKWEFFRACGLHVTYVLDSDPGFCENIHTLVESPNWPVDKNLTRLENDGRDFTALCFANRKQLMMREDNASSRSARGKVCSGKCYT